MSYASSLQRGRLELRLPYPPSVNSYWRYVGGRVLVSRAGRLYQHVIAQRLTAYNLDASFPLHGRLRLMATVHPPDRKRRDLDNVLKALLDALCKGGAYQDDSQIDRLAVRRAEPTPGGEVVVRLGVLPTREVSHAR